MPGSDVFYVPVGAENLVDDFTVSGAQGDKVQVLVRAGSHTSDSFSISALKEIQLGRQFSGVTSTEGTENFSLNISKIGDKEISVGARQIGIKDSYANWSPISFDLNGDGVQTISINAGVKFDMLNSGFKVNTGWLSGEDAFLATDDNGNGIIDDRSELFGGGVGEGFAELATFDSNGDGEVNASDDRFGELLVWQDANENGITDAGELVALASTDIASISTGYSDVFTEDAQGNILGEFGSAIRTDGSSLEVVDVYFQVDA